MDYNKCNRIRASIKLLHELLEHQYFDRFDVLNSDGRKVLARIGKLLAPVDGRLSRKAYMTLRNPTREALLKLRDALEDEYSYCSQVQ